MSHANTPPPFEASPKGLARPDYAQGSYLSADDLLAEQRYRWQRLRRHNRYLHGYGIICGLQVVPVEDRKRPWALQICPGYAIDCCGDEIVVTARTVVDVGAYLWLRPQHHPPVRTAYVGIRYREEDSRPMPVSPPGCGCDDPDYRPSRFRDSFQIDILWVMPETARPERVDLCEPAPTPCPDCPDSGYVILACITLPASEGNPITAAHIEQCATI